MISNHLLPNLLIADYFDEGNFLVGALPDGVTVMVHNAPLKTIQDFLFIHELDLFCHSFSPLPSGGWQFKVEGPEA